MSVPIETFDMFLPLKLK